MADKATDKVISYIIDDASLVKGSFEPLQKALDEGYRVIDILTTPVTAGGESSRKGYCTVTVLLSTDGSYWRKTPHTRAGTI